MEFAERNFGMWLIGRSIKVDQEAGQRGRVTRRKGSLEKQVTQAVLLGKTVLAAEYKMDHRMSPGKRERSQTWNSDRRRTVKEVGRSRSRIVGRHGRPSVRTRNEF